MVKWEKQVKAMTYDEAMDYIRQTGTRGSLYGLERMRRLLDILKHPEAGLSIIHVAGTNGKGSFGAFLDSILRKAGHRTGRFISPTLFDYRERIQVNGRYIEKEAVAVYVGQLKDASDQMADEGLERPTLFELETAMGFLYFRDKHCDYVILECGMGGRLDSTNVIPAPKLAVITAISLDHMAFLGDTEEQIAGEKAGIIKSGSSAVLYGQKSPATDVIAMACEKKGVPLKMTDWRQLKIRESSVERQVFDYRKRENLVIRMAGPYQIRNACLAADAADRLNAEGAGIPEEAIREGLLAASWPGRFERVGRSPDVIVDGAHNPAGAESLLESLRACYPDRKKILVMGVFADKDYEKILKIMSFASDTLIAFRPEHERGLDSEKLAETAGKYFTRVHDKKTAKQALRAALDMAGKKDVIACFGSLSTIAQFCDILTEKQTNRT